MINTTQTTKSHYTQLRKFNLYQLKTAQIGFRVSIGKSQWYWYNEYEERYNLREILNNEICIEFDVDDQNTAWEAINLTGVNLYRAGYTFEIWDHKGKSPHLHLRNLPISHLSKDELRLFKKVFIKEFVPKAYHDFVDYSLTGIHLIAVEWANHWKNKYGVKRLLFKFEPLEEQNEV